jgi:hypothetical protein
MADRIDSSSRFSRNTTSKPTSLAETSSNAEVERRGWPVGSNRSSRLQSALDGRSRDDAEPPDFGTLFESLGRTLRDPDTAWADGDDALRLGHLKYMGPGDLVTLVGDRDRLRSELTTALEAGFPGRPSTEIQGRVIELTDQIEDLFAARLRTTIAHRARQTIDVARRPFEAIARDETSRRTFLAAVACASNDPEAVAEKLAALGLAEDTCDELGDILAETSGERAVEALRGGEAGPTIDGWFSDEGAYDRADRLLRDALEEQLDHLTALEEAARRSAFEKPDAFSGGLSEDGDILTRPDFAVARQSVFHQLGLDPTRSNQADPATAGASAILAEAIDAAEGHDDRRAWNDHIINAGWGLMTAGAGTLADLTSLGAETAIRAGLARDELKRTRVAHHIGLAGTDAIAESQGDLAAVVATGVAAALFPDPDGGMLAEFVEMQMKSVAQATAGELARSRTERRVRDRHRGAHIEE